MEMVQVVLNEVVDNMMKMLIRMLGEDIEVIANLEPKLWAIQGDTGTLEQVLLNLAVNARDAMPDGGGMTIQTENVWVDDSHLIMMSDARTGQFVRLSVEDTGHGIDDETMNHLFEPFYTTKEQGKGTGLGLAVAYGVVQQHRGWINVYSEPGMGARFSIYLPATPGPAAIAVEETVDMARLHGNGEHVLLVEDEDGVRRYAARVLSENGYVVSEASNVADALQTFEDQGDDFNLIFSDVVLPDGSRVDSGRPYLRSHARIVSLPIWVNASGTSSTTMPSAGRGFLSFANHSTRPQRAPFHPAANV